MWAQASSRSDTDQTIARKTIAGAAAAAAAAGAAITIIAVSVVGVCLRVLHLPQLLQHLLIGERAFPGGVAPPAGSMMSAKNTSAAE